MMTRDDRVLTVSSSGSLILAKSRSTTSEFAVFCISGCDDSRKNLSNERSEKEAAQKAAAVTKARLDAANAKKAKAVAREKADEQAAKEASQKQEKATKQSNKKAEQEAERAKKAAIEHASGDHLGESDSLNKKGYGSKSKSGYGYGSTSKNTSGYGASNKVTKIANKSAKPRTPAKEMKGKADVKEASQKATAAATKARRDEKTAKAVAKANNSPTSVAKITSPPPPPRSPVKKGELAGTPLGMKCPTGAEPISNNPPLHTISPTSDRFYHLQVGRAVPLANQRRHHNRAQGLCALSDTDVCTS